MRVRPWVISVLSADRSSLSSWRRKAASLSLICSASAFGPVNPRMWSSAYAEVRVMPILYPECLVRAVSGYLVSA